MKADTPRDVLYRKVARKVLSESLALKKGEALTVEAWNNGLPFARHVVLEARRIGAIPLTIFEDEDAYVEGVRATPSDVLGKMGKHEYRLLSASDAYVFIPGPVLGTYSHRLPREEVNASTAYVGSWYKAAARARLRGVRMVFGYIGEDAVPILGKSVDSIVTHQLTAALADYKSIGRKAKELSSALKGGSTVTVKTHGAKLTARLTDVREVEDGIVNAQDLENESNVCYIPPGYVYAELDPETVSGQFHFSPTVTRFGLVNDGTAVFMDGKLKGVSSRASSSVLRKLSAGASPGMRGASALTVGLNPLLQYGYGQNASSAGVLGIRFLGVNFTARGGSLAVAQRKLVARGRL